MKTQFACAALCVVCGTALAQPVVSEPPEFPQMQPGPAVTYSGSECFLVAEGTIFPGDVDWIQVRIPRASSRTVIDVDFPTGASGSALLAIVENGTTGFNIADNNNSRDALCGMNASSTPQGSTRDSAVDLRETLINAVIDIAVTGAADTAFVGLHNESFAYELWAYALPYPCVDDLGCDDGVACTLDQCDVATGDCTNTPQDAACDDEFFCNGTEWCDAAQGCRTSGPPDCDDGVDCTDDYCDFGTDGCANDPWDEFCDNFLFCDGTEWCHPSDGCQAGEPVDCDDGLECTTDSCDEMDWVCLHEADDSACDDGLFCNGLEACDAELGCLAGVSPCGEGPCRESDDRCVSCLSNADCDDGQYCNGAEVCNALGQCAGGSYPCGESLCREGDDRCVDCLTDSDCDDGDYCNGSETCASDGVCEEGVYPCGEALCREGDDRCVDCLGDGDCADADFCNGDERCNTAGECTGGTNPCGDALCDEDSDACLECLSADDCADGAFCNGEEQCVDGQCMAGPPPCDGSLCREDDDQCVECVADEDCADDLFCNGKESCGPTGQCLVGSTPCGDDETCDEDAGMCVGQSFSLDIRPGACPAKVATAARGDLPVAIVGSDVKAIDVRSLRLSRADGVGGKVKPIMSPKNKAPKLKDVSRPSAACACPDGGPDGKEDLLVRFELPEVVSKLRLNQAGRKMRVELMISGKLKDGSSFSATDCVVVQTRTGNGAGSN